MLSLYIAFHSHNPHHKQDTQGSSILSSTSQQMTPIRGLISRDLNICLILFSSISVALRLYVRGFITKALGLDDAFSVAALVVLTAQSSLEIVGEYLLSAAR